MRLVSALVLLTVASPALAGSVPADRLAASWISLPITHFSPWDHTPVGRVVSVHAGTIADGMVSDALVSAANAAEHRNLAIEEIAQGWDKSRRTALEDLRDAQRAYASVAGGNIDARGQRFLALLKQVVDNTGRSSATEPSSARDVALSQIYDRVIRDVSDERLPAIEASETAWIAYRDAFDRFALSVERPDAAKVVRDDLARQRAEELQAEIDH